MIKVLPPLILQNSVWIPTRLFLLFFAKFEVRGFENIKNLSGPIIFAGNHANELDPILLPAALPFLSKLLPIFYVAKKREFYRKKGPLALIYGGAFFKLWGAYPVREGLKNYALSLNIHLEMLRQKKCLLVFPEGKITPDGNIQPAHGGVAFLSRETNSPIVPVLIEGNYKLTMKDFFSFKRQLKVTFGRPLEPKYLFPDGSVANPDEYKKIANVIMREIKELFQN